MPYIPPHLRPGYVPTSIQKKDFTGKVHWPTNINKNTNVIQGTHLGIVSAKSALKMTKPITLNTEPLKRPSMRLGHSKFNHAVKRHLSRKFTSKKRVSRRRSMSHGKKKLTRKKRTY